MSLLILYLVTPNLGLLRNYIKYKTLKLATYLRTPLLYLIIHFWLLLVGHRNIIYKTIIYERWYWFLYKSLKSYIKDDYNVKKEKYKTKYKLVKYKD
jgi:hypothetical protein